MTSTLKSAAKPALVSGVSAPFRSMPASPEWYELRALVAGKQFSEAAMRIERNASLCSAVNGWEKRCSTIWL